jgi:hypothetical protein
VSVSRIAEDDDAAEPAQPVVTDEDSDSGSNETEE